MTHFHGLNENEKPYQELQLQCVSAWLDLYDEVNLLKAFKLAQKLLGIYAALSYQYLYGATNGQLGMQKTGSIAGCLRTFLTKI